MRGAVIALALAACSSGRKATPKDAAPIVAVVAPPDATKELPIVYADDAFDFRQVPLEPEQTVGKDERCLVDAVEAHEGTTRLTCRANHAIAQVDVDGVVTTAPDQVLLLRIERAGAPPVAAYASLRGVEGKLPAEEPPSRCDCRDDHTEPPPPPPAAFDFRRIREEEAWGKVEVCKVVVVDDVYRVVIGSGLDPLKAAFGVQVYCGDVRVEVGGSSAMNLLAIRAGQYLALAPEWMGHDVPITAMFRHIVRDVPEPQ